LRRAIVSPSDKGEYRPLPVVLHKKDVLAMKNKRKIIAVQTPGLHRDDASIELSGSS
jgi:hypothetical protein